jgi:proteasome lid subunit RPN8/RPN11
MAYKMGMDISVTSGAMATMVEEARKSGNLECCGLLFGAAEAPTVIACVRPVANVHPDPARYFEIDPVALIGAYRDARDGGPALLGFYHSHPGGRPQPSATDCEHAGGDGRVWAIIAPGIAEVDVRFWRDTRTGFVALTFRLVTA